MTDNSPGTPGQDPELNPWSREGGGAPAEQPADSASPVNPDVPPSTPDQPTPPDYPGMPEYPTSQPGAADPYGQQPPQQGGYPVYDQPPAAGTPGYDAQPIPGWSGYGGQPGYGTGDQPAYGVTPYHGGYGGYQAYGVAAVQHPQAATALVTGILGMVVCPFVGVAGIVTGSRARREIDADPQRYTGRGMASAGLVLGILSMVWLVVLVLIFVLVFASSATS